MSREEYAAYVGDVLWDGTVPIIAVHNYGDAADSDDPMAAARYHVGTLGWPMYAYKWTIRKSGLIIKAYNDTECGYHVAGRNHRLEGWVFTGNLATHPPTPQQITSFIWLYGREGRGRPARGHYELALPQYPTSCPERLWPTWKHQIPGIDIPLPS